MKMKDFNFILKKDRLLIVLSIEISGIIKTREIIMIIIIILAANRRRKYSNDAPQQGRTESLQWRLWQPLYDACVTLEHSLQRGGISCMFVCDEGGKPENHGEKPSKQRKEPTQTQPTYDVRSVNRTRATLASSHDCAILASPND